MSDLISVVIPVYNAENYLKQCLDSVVKQTYQNLEIIVVDDGSTDRSGEICDEFAAMDERVVCRHIKNGGPGAARNAALELTHGSYIGFIDSDDWADRRLFEKLYEDAVRYNADITICNYVTITDGKQNLQYRADSVVMNRDEALKALISGHIESYMWNKLFLANMFKELRFCETKKFEDILIMHKLFKLCSRVYFDNESLYFYRYRPNSEAHMNTFLSIYDNLYSRISRISELKAEYPGEVKTILDQTATIYIWLCNSCATDQAAMYKRNIDIIKKVNPKLKTLFCELGYRHCRRGAFKDKIRFYLSMKLPNVYVRLEQLNMRLKDIKPDRGN